MRLRAFICVTALLLSRASSAKERDHRDIARALRTISADSLRGNLSFLASDALRGRWTPSPELDIAAEFIASRFREAGLEPGNGNSYFQVADLTELAAETEKRFRTVHSQTLEQPIIARNVVGLLRGSDPQLRDTYVIVSAHYDHLGTLKTAGNLSKNSRPINGDEIFNGANDDGSGTVSVIEIAKALAKGKHRPKRSIVFIAFCGEERGELGSQYYVRHPLFPLDQTVAEINIEQVGRSDSDLGKGNATLTGYDYTDMTAAVERSAKMSRVPLVRTKETDPYFQASDNFSFARAGIPDFTFATSYEFPDYHGLKDEWQKIDFPELAKVDRLLARVIWSVSNNQNAPKWNTHNLKAAKYANLRPAPSTPHVTDAQR